MDEKTISVERSHASLYEEVQESFVANLVRARRVAGGVNPSTGDVQQLQKADLAFNSKLSKGTVTKLTSSEPQDAKPDLETLCKLGSALNVSPAFLLMTPRDWSLLLQAFGTVQSLVNPEGEKEKALIQILAVGSIDQNINATVRAGLAFMEQLHGDDYSTPNRSRQQTGILAMTAIAQGAVRRQGPTSKMYATALGAILGDREISQH